jgi:hypothetical protein
MEFDEMYCLHCWNTIKMVDGKWYNDEFFCKYCFDYISVRQKEEEEIKRKGIIIKQEW